MNELPIGSSSRPATERRPTVTPGPLDIPTISIVITLESRTPRVYFRNLHAGDKMRWALWLAGHPALLKLLEDAGELVEATERPR